MLGDSGSRSGSLDQVERKRLVQREVVLQLVDDLELGPVALAGRSRQCRADQRTEELPGASGSGRSWPGRLVAVADQLPHARGSRRRVAQDVEEHSVGHLKARDERLRRSGDEPLEGLDPS